MRRLPLPLALALAFAATAGLAADAPLRPEKLRQAMGLKLGQWQTVSRIVDAQLDPEPGLAKADVERASTEVRAQIGKERTETECLSKDSADLYFPGMRAMPECKFSRIEARDGRLVMAALCKGPSDSGRIEVQGTYGPRRMTTRSQATVSTDQGDVRMKFESEGRFTGKCERAPVIVLPAPGAVAVPPAEDD